MRILVANDGSPGGEKAVRRALDLAKRLGVGLTMVCVEALDRFPAVVSAMAEAQRRPVSFFEPVAEADKALAHTMGVPFQVEMTSGHPVKRIIQIVENGAFNLLIVGHSGHGALFPHRLGSVADRLAAMTPCTVMVVK